MISGPPQSPDFVLLDWNGLESWITPVDQFFSASHYPEPTVDGENYSLEVTGAVAAEARPRPGRNQVDAEQRRDLYPRMLGQPGRPRFPGRRVQRPVDRHAARRRSWNGRVVWGNGIEVVFFGHDEGVENITPIRSEPLAMKQNFARSLTMKQAMDPDILLAYEVNGQTLPPKHGISPAPHRTRLVRHHPGEVAEADRGAHDPVYGPVHFAGLRHGPRGDPQRGDRLAPGIRG